MKYINEKIFGLPKLVYKSGRKKPNKIKKSYIHKVTIGNHSYYKVHLKRQDVSKIKYFKCVKTAELFVDMLRVNRYL